SASPCSCWAWARPAKRKTRGSVRSTRTLYCWRRNTARSLSRLGRELLVNGLFGAQRERGDLDVELISARAEHLIGAAHHAGRCGKGAPRGVFVRLARRQHRLLAHHTWTLYLFDVFQAIGDDPVPADQLDRLGTLIRNADS